MAKAELKEQILAMVAAGQDKNELAKEYGISRTTVTNWCRGSKNPKIEMPKISAEQLEIRELKKQIYRLEMERDVLKKAMAIVSGS